ncbi:MAG: PilZ domain-containing protein [Thiomicrospira sp.]|uniref:PilZ domain-containing protein n=1 Tax=Thiomicrospira sp. TaxID=935 RepID=UPI0019F37079|nr:PilZ domain-containing protein [Thiomicrospira sp.]MBE0493428.1 PilZ domain-containing protein [Thiomicrospira sp.]
MSNHKPHSNSEYRHNKRITTHRPIILNHQNLSLGLTMINLSLTGLGATGPIKLNANDLVELRLSLPFYDEFIELKLNARLVHSTPVRGQFLIGVDFDAISSHQQRIISNFIDSHAKSQL